MLLHLCEGDEFVYLDPPYYTEGDNFTSYVAGGFGTWHHQRLAWMLRKLHDRGCKFMLSNSNTEFIRDLYKQFRVEVIEAPRTIGAAVVTRKMVKELVIRNY